MAVKARKPARGKKRPNGTKGQRSFRPLAFVRRWLWRTALGLGLLAVLAVLAFRVFNPPTTHTIWTEARRLGGVDRTWVNIENVAPVMVRSVVAAEDANFCAHWGFDMDAIRAAIEEGANRGGSTISQQVVKNVYLWQARSYIRKAMEALLTPLVEALWPKRRILEVYLNVAEFDEGVFGIDAAARHYFGVGPEALSDRQAALLASVLPSPKKREANRPTSTMNRRAATIMDGAALIAQDGRAACFQD
ncbi:monofunctional biosynthetic peptidoglycan transglycosylase [Antarctobacter sp.]|uniref:monofunctional biosynthetic peptidoglycan transglycosylase n=1 Tax=Antarctobacter sp. TaxID=1872577 RepID=UPI002B279773|nr:monofunctional biosynthetic peptidoglycan transglycosylase [Antarctobacter sp.]